MARNCRSTLRKPAGSEIVRQACYKDGLSTVFRHREAQWYVYLVTRQTDRHTHTQTLQCDEALHSRSSVFIKVQNGMQGLLIYVILE